MTLDFPRSVRSYVLMILAINTDCCLKNVGKLIFVVEPQYVFCEAGINF